MKLIGFLCLVSVMFFMGNSTAPVPETMKPYIGKYTARTYAFRDWC